MTIQISTLGPRQGVCNICGEHGRLTEDHTPPKGCIKVSQVEMHHIVQHLSGEASAKGRISQNGVKYRTLCHRCNNNLLGTVYDPAFIAFINKIAIFIKTPISLPRLMTVRCQPQKIIRSLLGHMSAQGVNRYLKGPKTEAIRDYLLDCSLPLPLGIKIYYWLYPFGPHVMVRDAALIDLRVGKPTAMWLFKFFPVAFLVTWDEPEGYNFDLNSFESWRYSICDEEADLTIRLRPLIHQYWPEAPTDNSVILYGQEAMVALNRSLRKQR